MIRSRLIPALPLCCALLCASPLRADALPQETPEQMRAMADSLFETRFAIEDGPAEVRVPSARERDVAPLEFATFVMELAERAERATQAGKHASAARYWRALSAAVPERADALVELCKSYERAGESQKALGACAEALRHQGVTLSDYQHYVKLALAQPGELPAQRVDDINALLAHLGKSGADPLALARLDCDLGVRLLDTTRLARCTDTLAARAPKDLKTLGYQWVLAMQREAYDEALAVVMRARAAGMRPDAADVMEQSILEARSPVQRVRVWLTRSPRALSGGLLLLLSIALYLVRRRAPRTNPLIGAGA
jgi:tetratricopeptide (TPR) repeat protein